LSRLTGVGAFAKVIEGSSRADPDALHRGRMPQKPPERSSRPRLETQIHRRKKAKAFSPLLPEWEQKDQAVPSHLRMDATLMDSTAGRPKPDQGRTSGSSG
jgi:hypothetical protein